MKQKVFLIGGTGLVGRAIKNSLSQDYQVVITVPYPAFAPEHIPERVYQAVVPGRKEIPDTLQSTVSKILEALHKGVDILA